MLRPGFYSLGIFNITSATEQMGGSVEDLDGMQSALLQFRFSAVAPAGIAVRAYAQGSADQGTTWFDMACVYFTDSGLALLNLSALSARLSPLAPSDGALSDNSALDGLLTDRMRVKVISAGIWGAGSTLAAGLIGR